MASAMIHGIYAGDTRRLSIRAVFPQLWEAEREWGSVVLAGLFGGLARRKGWKKKSAWRLQKEKEDAEMEQVKSRLRDSGAEGQELVKSMEGASVWGIRGGLQGLTETLEERLRKEGVEFWMGEQGSVEQVEKVEGNWQVTTASTTLEASHLVTTIPSLLPSLSPPHLPATTASVVNLAFPRPPESSLPLFPPGFGYLIPRTVPVSQNPHHALGVIFDSDVMPGVDDSAAPHHDLVKVTMILGGSYWLDRIPVPQPSHDELVSAALSTLKLHFPSTALPAPVHVFSHTHRNCIPQVPPNSLPAFRAFGARLREAGNVAVVGGGFAAVGVNGCVKSAREVGSSFGEALNAAVAGRAKEAGEKSAKAVEAVRTGTEMWEV
ncbi:oxygen-dependent protoporphyrinogen oxidase [Rhodosporidiobolus nylandii]